MPFLSGNELRMCATYIHQGPCLEPDRFFSDNPLLPSKEIIVQRKSGLTAAEALREAMPYPAWAMDDKHHDVTLELLKATKGMHMYGAVDLSDDEPAPPPSA